MMEMVYLNSLFGLQLHMLIVWLVHFQVTNDVHKERMAAVGYLYHVTLLHYWMILSCCVITY